MIPFEGSPHPANHSGPIPGSLAAATPCTDIGGTPPGCAGRSRWVFPARPRADLFLRRFAPSAGEYHPSGYYVANRESAKALALSWVTIMGMSHEGVLTRLADSTDGDFDLPIRSSGDVTRISSPSYLPR